MLDKLLVGYHNRNYIVDGFKNGFDLHFEGKPCAITCNNAESTIKHANIVDEKISKEISLGRIAGPFNTPPFSNFKCSPLAIREKSVPGKFRLLHNLSYPYDDRAVNFNIPKDYSTVKYDSIVDAIELVNKCLPHPWLAKTDLEDAFYLIPIHPTCYRLTGFYWRGYYYFKVLPMGCSVSCSIFSAFSDAVRWILTQRVPNANVVKVLDDFLFVGRSAVHCQYQLNEFIKLCAEINLLLAQHKTVETCQSLVFLGINIDAKLMIASLPEEKCKGYSNSVKEALKVNKITLTELKSLLGKLQFASCVVRAGNAFLRRLYDLTCNVKYNNYKIRLTRDAKQDLKVWEVFLDSYNGVTIIREPILASSAAINLFTDASHRGYGGTYGSQFICGQFPERWKNFSITILETYPIPALLATFAHKLKNSRILFNCDNLGVVHIINKQSSKNAVVMKLVRPLVTILLTHNIRFTARHVAGKKNVICDMLSRRQVKKEELLSCGLAESPTPIPGHILPQNLL